MQRITITFNNLSTEYFADFVYIYDGYNSSSPVIATLSGYISFPLTYTTTQGYMFVRFASTGFLTYQGFNASYTISRVSGFDIVLLLSQLNNSQLNPFRISDVNFFML